MLGAPPKLWQAPGEHRRVGESLPRRFELVGVGAGLLKAELGVSELAWGGCWGFKVLFFLGLGD